MVFSAFFVFLSVRTIGFRRKAQISIGDGGVQGMLYDIRMNATFAEYIPFTFVLLVQQSQYTVLTFR